MQTTEVASRFVHLHHARDDRSYAPSFFDGDHINDRHASIVRSLADIPGKLLAADQRKLYEAGYYARGPILEIGRLTGKATLLLALGAADAGHDHPLFSIEWGHKHLATVQDHLELYDVYERVTLVQGDSSAQLTRLGHLFDTVFVDGDHSYTGCARDIRALTGRFSPGAVVMFHDYYHPGNDDPDNPDYGVREAVDELAAAAGLAFRGRFGAIAMFEQC